MSDKLKVGILCMQGAFLEHRNSLERLGVEVKEVRKAEQLEGLDGLVLPGGESTAIGKLIRELGIKDRMEALITGGLPVWGTCAGMILLAKKLTGSDVVHMPMMDIEVTRNAYGRQLGSFSADVPMKGVEGDVPMVFIRAPYINKSEDNVETLSVVDGNTVAARQKNMLVTSFHPELTDDLRVHEYFVNMVRESK
ncbi:5'-phosphate synthase pdxT subunit [Peptoclostridium litorale DSM 5388]|uniref:Pyridoxal 5'-phosphate synthase subunit PdxT n=1 Tax=Peptoclostridium litorale DSM 5388 TaxID=1121324 RepID=A0A069RI44_PEPLI|nr:pyridoxal 5'-phosphate synthase glutaminase subunit PdxT [Peptoclostridium litorale]KDR96699.1 glutamine amidotransferase subunit PdxT [Peptoclostridium litorale DSM 5388]SIN67606.1 5'-phosphate synthase pdxT subunit [Peptoclostridium litorale DSM 5388]